MRDNFNISALSTNMFADLNSFKPVPDLPAVTNISTNVYYGYQPQPVKNELEEKNVIENCDMEVQYSYSPGNNVDNQEITRVLNRKRRSTEQQEVEFKKRRENDNSSLPDPSSQPKFGRKPTHNLPDIPREIEMKIIIEKIEHWAPQLEEELLKQTHGCSSYHWRQETDL